MTTNHDNKSVHNQYMDERQFREMIENLNGSGIKFITLGAVERQDEVELIYYFQKNGESIIFKTLTREKTASSLYSYYGKSDFPEREINHLLGVKFLGHPNLDKPPGMVELSRIQ